MGGLKPTFKKFADGASALAFPLVLFLFFIGSFIYNWYSGRAATSQLDIVAYLEQEMSGQDANEVDSWVAKGRVLNEGDPVSEADVWIIARDLRGQRFSPPTDRTKEDGEFRIADVPTMLSGSEVVEVEIHARRKPVETGKEASVLGGKVILATRGGVPLRKENIPFWSLLFLPAIFLGSMLLPFLTEEPGRRIYVASLVLAVLFTFLMIGSISYGLAQVHYAGERGQVFSMGFASIFPGTYIEDGQEEWLFSFTSPSSGSPIATLPHDERETSSRPAATAEDSSPAAGAQRTARPAATPPAQQASTQADQRSAARLVKGFGAPLWVLLLAVLGAGILTVSLLVEQIGNPPLAKQVEQIGNPPLAKQIRDRINIVVRHQYYILFSPIGAVFVYQMLVASGAAQTPLAVALTALGAGVAMNVILKYAVTKAKQLFE